MTIGKSCCGFHQFPVSIDWEALNFITLLTVVHALLTSAMVNK